MDLEAKKLIQEQYAKLPSVLQQAIQSANLHEQIISIGQKNQLHVDQVGQLEDETVMLMMGFIDPDDFAATLQEELHLDQVKALGVANDIGEKILTPIREKMQNLTDTKQPVVQSASMPTSPKPITPPPAQASAMPSLKPVVPPASPIAKVDTMLSQPTVSMAPKPAEIMSKPAPTPAPTPTPASSTQASAPTAPVQTPSSVMPSSNMAPASAPIAPKPAEAPKPAVPPPPSNYKIDPYREPIEP